jgi:LacI family xylobiose transport system transcriptional regulator
VSRKATLESIAVEAAVSISTVSKVLNGRPGVSAPTRERVELLLEQRGYQPRGRANDPSVIEVVYTVLDNEWIMEILQGVEKVASPAGLSIVLTPAQVLSDPNHDWVETVIKRRTSGVIVLFSGLTERQKRQLSNRSIPFVVVDPGGEPEPGVPYVGSQNWAGGLAAGEHLIKLGHRRIGVITGPKTRLFSRARLSGFTSALSLAGLELPPEYVRTGAFHAEDGLREGRALLGLPQPPTAIFASSDLQAMGVYDAAGEAGLRIPQDLSVLGYDDLPLAHWAGPPLTTIRQPVREMAETAARMLTGLTDGTGQLDLAVSLVARQSTAPPAA